MKKNWKKNLVFYELEHPPTSRAELPNRVYFNKWARRTPTKTLQVRELFFLLFKKLINVLLIIKPHMKKLLMLIKANV